MSAPRSAPLTPEALAKVRQDLLAAILPRSFVPERPRVIVQGNGSSKVTLLQQHAQIR